MFSNLKIRFEHFIDFTHIFASSSFFFFLSGGIAHDREFFIIDASTKKMVTAREIPLLVRIEPNLQHSALILYDLDENLEPYTLTFDNIINPRKETVVIFLCCYL